MTIVDRVRGDYRKPKSPRAPLTALPLRPYQRQALDETMRKIVEEGLRTVAVVLPTGGGKTVCFAHQAMEWIDEHPEDRVLVLVHRNELATQALDKIKRIAPHLDAGLVKANHNEVNAQVVVAGVQTLARTHRRDQVTGVGLIIIDECHHAVAASYTAVIEHYAGAKVVGYTATLMRTDGAPLGRVWQDVAFTRDISWMVRQGYLVPPRGLAVEVPDLDLAGVRTSRGDFADGDLGEALADSLAPELVAKAVLEHAPGRKVLAFFPTVAACYVFAEAFESAGIPALVVHGGMSDAARAETLAWHARGTVLVNCMLLTEGYDDPEVDCVVVGRPTKSKPLYIQIAGRGLRVDPARPYEEQDCLLLHVTPVDMDLRGIVDLSDKPLPEPREGATLIELEDEFDAGEGVEPDAPTVYNGQTITREFDPLGRPSTRVWIRTKGGTYFLPAGRERYVFIMEYPVRGRWSVASCPVWSGRPVMSEHRGLPLEEALVWAEDLALNMGADLNTTNKRASWRKRPPTPKTLEYAARLGLEVGPDERMGDVSDRITEHNGTRRIDPLVAAATRKGK